MGSLFYMDGDSQIGLTTIRANTLDELPFVAHAFCTKKGGQFQGKETLLDFSFKQKPTQIKRSYVALANRMAIDSERIYLATQVHGNRVLRVGENNWPSDLIDEEADALITSVRGISVGVLTADCVPILIADRKGELVAAIHAGWRGLVEKVITKTIEEFEKDGIPAANLVAAIGPCIQVNNYEVSQEIAEFFDCSCITHENSVYKVDLSGAARLELNTCGVEGISLNDRCTYEDSEYFYSFRKDSASGRQLSFIGLR